jgi:DNA-binding transcriptional ArsR family regulator
VPGSQRSNIGAGTPTTSAARSSAAAARQSANGGRPSQAAEHRLAGERDPVAVRRFIEQFTAELTRSGFPRTPARIFVALMTSDSSTLTASELAELLQTSPASVSSGARYLLQVGLATAEGEPGSRRLHYRMSGHVWHDIIRMRDRQFTRWAAELRQGVDILGPTSAAGARMAESVEYFEFISHEVIGMLARWEARSGYPASVET